jgi:hypothetical protein
MLRLVILKKITRIPPKIVPTRCEANNRDGAGRERLGDIKAK